MGSRLNVRGRTRFGTGLAAGAVIAAIVWPATGLWQLAPMVVVTVTAAVYLVWSIRILWPMDAASTRAHAEAADVRDELGDAALIATLAVCLSAVGVLLLSAGDRNRSWYATLAVIAVLAAWGMLHTLFASRYARIYYGGDSGTGEAGGIDFNTSDQPCYVDFFYFAFNLGMTYQVSDTSVGPRHPSRSAQALPAELHLWHGDHRDHHQPGDESGRLTAGITVLLADRLVIIPIRVERLQQWQMTVRFRAQCSGTWTAPSSTPSRCGAGRWRSSRSRWVPG
ncbi:hypothetical protein SCNU_05001 [Gordonia neofelifaecis NRRL B-59395]|uniref:DUF1345 domain-containing protein n=1 Tax=Gordonia neofelifaecis NRRL B-59395 TaxID=644548 RepID=F1YGN6_9ACTN|nr:DUF1345 domain-containing protein [Gordonia neofelifaecis]EGD56184.1 hypothetical protein SCNU_05001 [Gordonia neofelifaecis NRRL B-59395]